MQEMILLTFLKKKFFRIKIMYLKQKKKEKLEEELDENKFFKDIENKSEGINYESFEKHFNFSAPTVLAKELFETTDKNKTIKFVNVIKSGLHDLKDEIKKMSEDE